MDTFKRALARFARGFIAGGVASAAALIATGVTLNSAEDLKKFGIALAIAFVTGGILGIDKITREYFSQES